MNTGWVLTARQLSQLNIVARYNWRIRFAWWPVELWRLSEDKPYIERAGKRVWLRPITERYGFGGEWVAWEDDQPIIQIEHRNCDQ